MLLNELAFNVKKLPSSWLQQVLNLRTGVGTNCPGTYDRKDEIIKVNAEDLKRSEEENLAAPL